MLFHFSPVQTAKMLQAYQDGREQHIYGSYIQEVFHRAAHRLGTHHHSTTQNTHIECVERQSDQLVPFSCSSAFHTDAGCCSETHRETLESMELAWSSSHSDRLSLTSVNTGHKNQHDRAECNGELHTKATAKQAPMVELSWEIRGTKETLSQVSPQVGTSSVHAKTYSERTVKQSSILHVCTVNTNISNKLFLPHGHVLPPSLGQRPHLPEWQTLLQRWWPQDNSFPHT